MSFFVIEGPNGAGKTTLVNNFKSRTDCLSFSSPDGTEMAKIVRPLARGVGDWATLPSFVKFLLFSAARYDEYMKLVHGQPKDKLIICDRWWTSTYVYQCCNGDIPVDALEHTIHPQEELSGIILLDAPDEILWERTSKERSVNSAHGSCVWTANKDLVKAIAGIYRNDFVKYISNFEIPLLKIDVSTKSAEDVYTESLSFIDSIQKGS
jgi:thymidylate kinase